MELKLLKLSLKNFKGIKSFTFEPDGNNAEIFGNNASGKTTLADAFFWLLFNKDSQNKTDFEIKTIDPKTQQVKHNLEHEVSAVIFTDKEVRLKKIYSETWTKKRGSATKEFTGHSTNYFIDDVPTPAGEYKRFIPEIAPEATFRLLTDPRFFNKQTHWEERRRILLDAFGDITDTKIITSNPSLKDLPGIVGDRTMDDHRKIIAARRAVINKELEKIPVRIDECNRDLPDVSDLSKDALEKTAATLATEIKAKNTEKARIENGGQVAELQKKLRRAEADHIDRQNEAQKKTNEQVQDLQKKISELNQQSNGLNDQIIAFDKQIKLNDASLIQKNADREKLLDQYRAIKSRQMACPETETVCPTCGQDLPEDQIKTATDKAIADFNLKQAEDLTENKKNGMAAAADIQQLKNDNDASLKQIVGLTADKGKFDGQVQTLQDSIKKLETLHPESTDTTPEIVNLKTEIEKLQTGTKSTSVIDEEIKKLGITRDSTADLLADIKTCETAKKRIADLEAEEKDLAAEFEKLESELNLCDEFTRAKVKVLESKINDKFKIAKFKLFETQINGGLNECCVVVKDGVPYSSINNASKINIGLDIINTLAGVYDFSAPIWVDNSEAVTDFLPVTAQLIKLTVSVKNKKLKVNVEKPKEAVKAA